MFLLDLMGYVIRGRRNAKLDNGRLRAMQSKKFTDLLAYVSIYSPYYRQLIREHGIDITSCQPDDFPVLTKDTVLEHFDQMVTDRRITKAGIAEFLEQSHDPLDLYLGRYTVIHTSGSSGTVGFYPYAPNELACGIAHFTRLHSPALGQKLAYVGAVKGHFAGATMVSAAKKIPGIYRQVALLDINQPFGQIVDSLNDMQPTTLSGYAFALRKLAEAQEAGKLHIQPRLVQTGGEPLSSADKSYIQSIFTAPVVNIYAASEHLIMGIGKDDFDGMYLMEDDLIFEPAPDCTYVTNLFNRTLPLIRYQMSDRLQTVPDERNVLPFTKVADIVGRNEYVPVFLNDIGEEDFISPILLVEFYVQGVSAFQFRIIDNRKFVFKVSLDGGLSQNERTMVIERCRRKLCELLAEKQMTHVRFDIEIVNRLWADPKTGKFRLITK